MGLKEAICTVNEYTRLLLTFFKTTFVKLVNPNILACSFLSFLSPVLLL